MDEAGDAGQSSQQPQEGRQQQQQQSVPGQSSQEPQDGRQQQQQQQQQHNAPPTPRSREPQTRSQAVSRASHPRMTSHTSSRARPGSAVPRPLQRPVFSLAGTHAPGPLQQSYVDPSYYELNPRYAQPANKPLWGLAKPLPRVVRPAMRKNEDPRAVEERLRQRMETEAQTLGRGRQRRRQRREDKEQGLAAPRGEGGQKLARGGPPATMAHAGPHQDGTQAAPQVDKIPSQQREEERHDERREERHMERSPSGQTVPSHSQTRTQPQAGPQEGSHLTQKEADFVTPTPYSARHAFERFGSPLAERGNPMEDWTALARTASGKTVEDGDVATRVVTKLEDIPETKSGEIPYVGRDGDSDSLDVDLEAGEAWDDGLGDEKDHVDYAEEEIEYYNAWTPIRAKFREPFAECLATFVSQIIGLSTNLSIITSNDSAGTYQSSNWSSGLGIMIGIYLAGGISGGHINPAISIMLSITRGFPPRKVLIYIIAQCLGSFLAALLAFAIYYDAIIALDHGSLNASLTGSGHAFLPALAAWTSPAAGFANEFIATGILACAILALGDDENAPPGAGMHALIVGLVVTAIGMAFGYPTGACINPAKDFGPRLATLVVGYGGQVFTMDKVWWVWGGWAATVCGAVVGGCLYDTAIFTGGESPINYLGRRRMRAGKRVDGRRGSKALGKGLGKVGGNGKGRAGRWWWRGRAG